MSPKIVWTGEMNDEEYRIVEHSRTYYVAWNDKRIDSHYHLESLIGHDSMGGEQCQNY
jgi:hypothetical protein